MSCEHIVVRDSSCHHYSVKDRQQELTPVLVASRYIGHYHVPLIFQYMYHIHSISLLYGLLIDVKYVKKKKKKKNHMD